VVVWGTSFIDESMVTGESKPISKQVSSSVIGGTINLHGALHIKATQVGSNTVLSQIISLVETAQLSKAPIQQFADYVSVIVFIFLFNLKQQLKKFIYVPFLLVHYYNSNFWHKKLEILNIYEKFLEKKKEC